MASAKQMAARKKFAQMLKNKGSKVAKKAAAAPSSGARKKINKKLRVKK